MLAKNRKKVDYSDRIKYSTAAELRMLCLQYKYNHLHDPFFCVKTG